MPDMIVSHFPLLGMRTDSQVATVGHGQALNICITVSLSEADDEGEHA